MILLKAFPNEWIIRNTCIAPFIFVSFFIAKCIFHMTFVCAVIFIWCEIIACQANWSLPASSTHHIIYNAVHLHFEPHSFQFYYSLHNAVSHLEFSLVSSLWTNDLPLLFAHLNASYNSIIFPLQGSMKQQKRICNLVIYTQWAPRTTFYLWFNSNGTLFRNNGIYTIYNSSLFLARQYCYTMLYAHMLWL